MKIKGIILIGVSATVIALPSCKKDSETSSTKEYLGGTLTFSMPEYVLKGEEYDLTPSGLTNPGTGSADDIGYYWSTSWNSGKDTTKTETDKKGDGTYRLTTPSKVGEFTVSAVAFASGYYTSSKTATFFVVDPALDSTVAGAYSSKDPFFTDPRNNGAYYTSTVNGKTWMKNNLYYSGSGVSYEGCDAMDAIFGRYYSWNEAIKACPDGWHLPSEAEFAEMANALAPKGTEFTEKDTFTGIAGDFMVNAEFLGSRMWEYWPQVKITNKSGFSALPLGYAMDLSDSPVFSGIDDFAMFWTSTSLESGSESDDGEGQAYCRYINVKQNDILTGPRDKESFRASVRCVKD